jgi:hypothetical protein
MQKQIHLLLGELDVFQILDGLEAREQSWRKTAAYLETEEFPDDDVFLIEGCSSPQEATNIADAYARIIETIRKQQTAQAAPQKNPDRKNPSKDKVEPAFTIYINAFCSGLVAIERDENNLPVAYATEHGAQMEIVDSTILRLEQFLAGERDFDDAITIEEYVVPVDLHPDGSITDEDGNTYPNW